MAFFRRWFPILCALLAGGAPLWGASSREQLGYAAACAAFQDKFYDQAETGLTQFLQNYRKSTNAPQAVLLLAQAQYYQRKYPEAIVHLTDTNSLAKAQAAGLADSYVYWTAEARFASGDLQGAADTFASLLDQFPKSPLAVNAVVEGAAALGKLGDWPKVDELLDNTNSVFQRAARLDTTNQIVADARLLQAESKLARQDYTAAIAALHLLETRPLTPEQDWKRWYLWCRADQGRNDLAAALLAAANARQVARQGLGGDSAANLAESVALYAGLLEEQGELADAAAAWQENLTNGAPVELQQRAILKTAELAAAQGKLPDAEAALDNYLAKFPASAPAELARLSLGELHLKDLIAQPLATNQLTAALTNLAAATNSAFAGKAFLDLGWCNWLAAEKARDLGDTNTAAQKLADSLFDFQAAAQPPRLPVSEDLAVARFKMGDAQFALKDFGGAQTNYLAVLEDFPGLTNVAQSLGERALYQIVRSRLELHDTNLDTTMRQLLDKFFTNAPVDSSLLLAGKAFSSFGSPGRAREMFLKFERECTNSSLLPQAAFAVARTFEREQNWPATVTNCENWLQAYPTNELRPQVEYARDWAVGQTGDEAGAFEWFTNFVVKYPANTDFTPLALWWVADHYFRQGTFTDAEKYYQIIYQNFLTNVLANPARLMAGRADMGRFDYDHAITTYLTPLINDTNCPGDLRDQARFAYCEARRLPLMSGSDTNTASLQEATILLAQMYPEAATNQAGAMAWCETGDCDLLMGAFDAATNAYAQALNSPSASRKLCSRARVGLGIVLEKKAAGLKAAGLPAELQQPLLSLALQSYADVLYPTNEVADPFWMKEAALKALPLMKLLKVGDVDNLINRMEYWLPSLKNTLEKKRTALPN